MPEPFDPSSPVMVSVGDGYQPLFEAGARAAVDVGLFRSTDRVTSLVASTLPSVSVERQWNQWRPHGLAAEQKLVGPVYGVHAPPTPMKYSVDAIAEAASVAVSVISGFVMYQPLRPSGEAGAIANAVTGFVVSETVTLKVDVLVFEWASVFEQVTGVVPFGNFEPETGEQVELPSPSTASCDAGLGKFTMVPLESAASTVMFAGVSTTGFVVSCTITWNVAGGAWCRSRRSRRT